MILGIDFTRSNVMALEISGESLCYSECPSAGSCLIFLQMDTMNPESLHSMALSRLFATYALRRIRPYRKESPERPGSHNPAQIT